MVALLQVIDFYKVSGRRLHKRSGAHDATSCLIFREAPEICQTLALNSLKLWKADIDL